MDVSDWDDKVILERTVLQTEGGLARLSLDLGDGDKPVQSELAQPDELRKRMIAWCEAVRDEIKSRAQRKRPAPEAPATRTPAEHTAQLQTPQNAVAYAQRQYEIAADMLADFLKQRTKLDERIEEVKQNLAVWAAVVAQFNKAISVDAEDLPE